MNLPGTPKQQHIALKTAITAGESAVIYGLTRSLRRRYPFLGWGASLLVGGLLIWLEPGRRLADLVGSTMRLLDEGNPLGFNAADDCLDLQPNRAA